MPYIPKEERKRFDKLIDALVEEIKKSDLERQDGQLNYIITRLLKSLYPPRYFNFNRALGVLTAIKSEFYRRFIAPYEDEKIKEHGDV